MLPDESFPSKPLISPDDHVTGALFKRDFSQSNWVDSSTHDKTYLKTFSIKNAIEMKHFKSLEFYKFVTLYMRCKPCILSFLKQIFTQNMGYYVMLTS